MTSLTKQDVEVLNTIAKEKIDSVWKTFRENATFHKGTIEQAVVLARLTETKRCLKEIGRLLSEAERKEVLNVGGEHSAFVLGFDTAMARLKKGLEAKE